MMSELRTEACPKRHPLERSYRSSMNKWVCRDCRNERTTANRATSDGANKARTSRRERERLQRELRMSLGKGYPPPWKPGLGHCGQDHQNPDWIRRPGPDTAYLLSTCNGRQGLPACPMKAQCLVWANDQPQFVGIAGGEMFGMDDKEEQRESAA